MGGINLAGKLQQEILQRLETGTLEELRPESTFNFACSAECMGNCCRHIDIYLDPWDVETMARHLALPGQEFIHQYCSLETDEGTGWPVVRLKHVAGGPCTFVLPDGRCSIYPHRPRNCRSAPVARAVRFTTEDGTRKPVEKIFMLKPADTCQGHMAGKKWTVKEWLEDSGTGKYYELADIYLEVVDYAVNTLHSRQWLRGPAAGLVMPFLFAPDILRAKLNIPPDKVGHEEFYRRRMQALRQILTTTAAGLGYGPAAKLEQNSNLSIMDVAKKILLEGC